MSKSILIIGAGEGLSTSVAEKFSGQGYHVSKKSICRASILKAARKIITEHGWATLSMRYLAKAINYTAPILYNYFPAKEDLVSALVEMGYSLLIRQIKAAWKRYEKPDLQLNAAWMAYREFGKSEKALYQAMFGVGLKSPESKAIPNGIAKLSSAFQEVISPGKTACCSQQQVCPNFQLQWAAVHGLISLNLTSAKIPEALEMVILTNAINLSHQETTM